jgi:hypothetical protein
LASQGELLSLFAPRPQAIFNAIDDWAFPVAGAESAVARAKEVYALFGADAAIEQQAFPGGHDYSRHMREALYGFLDLHLRGLGDGSPAPEAEFELPAEDDPDFTVFAGGFTSSTARDLAWTSAIALASQLADPDQLEREALRKRLRLVLGAPEPGEPRIKADRIDGLSYEKWRIESGGGRVVSALYFHASEDAPTIILTDPAAHTEAHPGEALRAKGLNVLFVSPHGHGETAWTEHLTATDHLMIGEPILVRRASDLVLARRALQEMRRPRSITLVALHPDSALAGLLAQALWEELDAAILGPVPGSVLDSFVAAVPLSIYVPRILEAADVPHLVWLAGERPLFVDVSPSEAMPWSPSWEAALAPFIRAVNLEEASRIVASAPW